MASEAYQNDVMRVKERLQAVPLEFEPPSPMTAGVYMIELHIRSSDLRAISAVNNAFQLAFDAAGMAVLGSTDEVSLNLIWGGSGSWREVFIVSPRTALGRERLNYLVGTSIAALPMIEGIPPAVGSALYAIFAGSMLVASSFDSQPIPISTVSVDASALSGVGVNAELYPPGRVWRPPLGDAGRTCLSNLGDYVRRHEDDAYFTVFGQADAHYDVALIVESQIDDRGKAEAIAQWHADQDGLPYR
ncbi:hypothetical protein [Leifsonia sp. WHRI 6310E]|uniref:hypothetical protein n=1 Tax=Leifsonia sp. WHRI 6310E TaxID=3162562 RepID=UPI0032EC7CC0